jgi:hypothetical protein
MRRIVLTISLAFVCLNMQAQILLAEYKFQNNANDSIGNHNGTLLNGPTYTTDRFGNPNSAILLDGVNDYIELANGLTLQANTYTYDVWVKPYSNPGANSAKCIMSIGGNGGDQFLTNANASGVGFNISGYQNPSGTYNLISGVAPIINEWYHLTGTRDVTVARLYVNGILVDTAILGAATTPKYGQNLAYIGRRTNNGVVGPQYFHGAIDDLKIYAGINTPLPLDFISFTGTLQNNTAQLYWETANKINVSKFEIEKSSDAISFSKIGSVASSEKEQYGFTDTHLFDRNNYYRIKVIDLDQQVSYSKTILLLHSDKTELTLFPNPVKDELHIATSTKDFRYQITDIYGRKWISGTSATSQAPISCAQLPKGIYHIRLEMGHEVRNLKFLHE